MSDPLPPQGPKLPGDCARMDLLLEPFLDRELSAEETTSVEQHLLDCARCRSELQTARTVRSELRGLPKLECPPEIAQQALDVARVEMRDESREEESGGMTLWLRAAAALVLLSGGMLAGALLFGDRGGTPELTGEYTAAEIAQAEEELRFALGYFGSIARRAGDTLRDDVLVERVFEPPRRAFERLGAMQAGSGATTGVPASAGEESL